MNVSNMKEMMVTDLVRHYVDMGAALRRLDGYLDGRDPESVRVNDQKDLHGLKGLVGKLETSLNSFVTRAGQFVLLELDQLGHVLEGDHNMTVNVKALMNESVNQILPVLWQKGSKISMVRISDSYPEIRGSMEWLAQVLAEYLRQSVRESMPGTDFVFTMKSEGTDMRLQFKNVGVDPERAFHKPDTTDETADVSRWPELSHVVADRVIKMHGGQTRMLMNDASIQGWEVIFPLATTAVNRV